MAARRDSSRDTDGQDRELEQREAATPDVVLDVTSLSVDEIVIDVDRLHARIALEARLAGLIQLHVGADVDVENVGMEIKGVQAEAHLRAHLDNVASIMDRALDTVDQHPEIVLELGRGAIETAEAIGDGGGDLGRLAERVAPTPAGELGAGTAEAKSDSEADEEDESSDERDQASDEGDEPRRARRGGGRQGAARRNRRARAARS